MKEDINALTEDIFLKKDEEEKLQNFLIDITSENLIKETTKGLTVPSYSLSSYVYEALALLDYFNEIINKSDILARTASEYTLINMLDSYQSISCLNHERKIELFVNRVIPNIILNNKRKLSTEFVPVDTIKSFKKRQRKIIIVLRIGNGIFFEDIYQV